MEKKYNLKNPAVKRLMREAAELKDPTVQYYAQPLEDNLFEWHFTVRGPPDTEFSDGIYHGRITLPPEYPMKPPSIILLTPNGRFEVGKKICLSMSAHHPETWQPSWSLRTVMLALIGFMPTKGAGAIGSLDYPPEERKLLASKSKDWKCEICDFEHRTCLLDLDPESTNEQVSEAKELAAQINFKGEVERTKSSEQGTTTFSNVTAESKVDTQPTINSLVLDELQTASSGQEGSGVEIQDKIENQQTSSSTSTSSNIRQRHTAPLVEEVSFSNDANLSRQNSSGGQRPRSSAADYISLILLWIVAAILVFLILRRLALDNESLSTTN